MIKEIREKHGLSRAQLSRLTGIPVRTIQNWELGIRKYPEYVPQMITATVESKLPTINYREIVEDILSMLESDLKYAKSE